jgi:hypothetical protein
MGTVLWIIAVVLAILGVMQIIGGNLLWGIVLLVLAAAVGPGGWSIFNRRAV